MLMAPLGGAHDSQFRFLLHSGVSLPDGGLGHTLLDYRVRVENGEYELWSDSVPRMEIESHRVAATDVVITTTDTVRHSDVLSAFLGRRLPLVLCGTCAEHFAQQFSVTVYLTGFFDLDV
jgi:dynein heavy chain 1, cytosolic